MMRRSQALYVVILVHYAAVAVGGYLLYANTTLYSLESDTATGDGS